MTLFLLLLKPIKKVNDKVEIINRDIFLSTEDCIIQQCNSESKSVKGFVKAVFEKYPEANTYGQKRVFGTCDIIHTSSGKIIVNMYAQKGIGRNSGTSAEKLDAFRKCLFSLPTNLSYAIPYKIGCGLGGGSWSKYLEIINKFSKTRNCKIYKLV